MKREIFFLVILLSIEYHKSTGWPPYVPFPPAPMVGDFYPENIIRMGIITMAIVLAPTFSHFVVMWTPTPAGPMPPPL